MKLVYIGVFKNETRPAVELTCERKLDSYNYFTRSSVGEFMTVFATEVAAGTKPGERRSVADKSDTDNPDQTQNMIHAYARTEGVCGIIITDKEYPNRVAHGLLTKVLDDFVSKYPRTAYINATKSSTLMAFPELKDYITKYQDPQQADSIMKLQQELDETKIHLHKSIESVLQRGEKIDDLVAKSDGLSAQSKMFYTQAKKQNSCCTVM